MNYYYPEIGSQSKATWVLDSLVSADTNATIIRDNTVNNGPGVFWGLVKNNYNLIKEHQAKNVPYYFTDMPYWGRWMGNNRSECYWRVIPNNLHCSWVEDYPSDRFNKLNVNVKEWRTKGDHILVCPSSVTMSRFYNRSNWLNETLVELRKYTDRPIKIRNKPRDNKTSGPRAATIPFEDDVKDAWAVVTLASIAGVEAACLGIPVFADVNSPCSQLGNLDLSLIENPKLVDRKKWLNTLSYYQYTEEELKKGMGVFK
jgi:hypothetical protein